MKIAILSHYATWALEGHEGYQPDPQRHPVPWVMNLAHALAQLDGVEVHVVTQTDEIACDMQASSQGVTLHFVHSPRRLRAATFFQFDRLRLHRALRAINPDVVHAHGTEDAYGVAGLTSGFPCVITMQGMMFKINERVPVRVLSRGWLVERIERWCLRHAHHIIAKSDHVADSIQPLAPHAVIHRIPNAMNPVFFQTTSEPLENRLLFAGIIAPVKGLEYLVEALALVRRTRPSVTLAIVGIPGHGSESYDAAIRRQIAQRGLQNAVTYLGLQRADGVAREMARSSIIVVPSLEEMFCNVAAEAMAVGRPVIASRAGSLPQLVRDGKTGLLVKPQEPAELAEAIARLLADGDARAQMGAAARVAARQQWHPGEVARQTLTVYEIVRQTGAAGL